MYDIFLKNVLVYASISVLFNKSFNRVLFLRVLIESKIKQITKLPNWICHTYNIN